MIINHNSHRIELFSSTQSLPILRFQRFNKYWMLSTEIGSTFADYDRHMAQTTKFLQSGMIAEAIQELENKRQSVFNIMHDFNPAGKALALLVKRINDTDYTKLDENTEEAILQHLEKIGFTQELTYQSLIDVKKN